MSGEVVIALGSDHAGFLLKEELKGELRRLGYEVKDVGTDSEDSCDYPDFARQVAEAVGSGEASRGVLVCGTGVGMAMAANKIPNVRAAVCNDAFCARMSRAHNDANVLTIGARVVTPAAAKEILDTFLETPYEGAGAGGERHARRLSKLSRLEADYMKGADGGSPR